MTIEHLSLGQCEKDEDQQQELGDLNRAQYRPAEHLSQKHVSDREKHHRKKGYRGNTVHDLGYGMNP
jgi:hypothetical protein